MDHVAMIEVLDCLAEVDSGGTAEIAERVNRSRDYVSLLLGRCWKRGFVKRTAYKRGRVRGFTYKLSERGADWLSYKASAESEASSQGQVSEISPANPETTKTKRQIVIVDPEAGHSFLTRMPFSFGFGFLSGQQAAERNALSPVIIPGRLSEEEYHYLAGRFEREKKEEVQPLVELLKEKDKTIRYLLKYIFKSKRRLKLPEQRFFLKPIKQVELKRFSAINKLSIQQQPKTARMGAGRFSFKPIVEEPAVRSWLPPIPPEGRYVLDRFSKVPHDELASVNQPRFLKSSNSNEPKFRLPAVTPRLPFDCED